MLHPTPGQGEESQHAQQVEGDERHVDSPRMIAQNPRQPADDIKIDRGVGFPGRFPRPPAETLFIIGSCRVQTPADGFPEMGVVVNEERPSDKRKPGGQAGHKKEGSVSHGSDHTMLSSVGERKYNFIMIPINTSSLTIRTYGDPILQKKTRLVTDLAEVKDLIPAMFDLMYAEPGIGLAANQVGVSLRLAVIDVPEEGRSRPLVLVNPKVEDKKGRVKAAEGCLSLPGISVTVARASSVRVSALNEHGFPVVIQAEGLLARCLQHEIDHLDGLLMIDRLSLLERMKVLLEIRKRKKDGTW
jgi:peptide deformylase